MWHCILCTIMDNIWYQNSMGDLKSQNNGMAEQQNGRNEGTGGKSPEILKDRVTENHPKSLNMQRWKVIPNPERWNYKSCLRFQLLSTDSCVTFASYNPSIFLVSTCTQREFRKSTPDTTTLTALIILPWTPKVCLECLLWCNQSHARSSHHRSHRQRTVIFVLFKDTNCLIRN